MRSAGVFYPGLRFAVPPSAGLALLFRTAGFFSGRWLSMRFLWRLRRSHFRLTGFASIVGFKFLGCLLGVVFFAPADLAHRIVLQWPTRVSEHLPNIFVILSNHINRRSLCFVADRSQIRFEHRTAIKTMATPVFSGFPDVDSPPSP